MSEAANRTVRSEPVATRTFSLADQQAFALYSGDHNPMHLDAQAARRTQAGAPVVHGMHGVLWALDRLAAHGAPLSRLAGLKVQFPKFAYLDGDVVLRVVRRTEQALKAELAADGVVAAVLDLAFGPRTPAASEAFGEAEPATRYTAPRPLDLGEIEGLSGRLAPPEACEKALRFPSLDGALGERRVDALAQLSTLVGMACPGLHSIFSGFSVTFVDDDGREPGLAWRTARIDDRFRLVWMDVRGPGVSGQVQAFVRTEPVEAPSVAAMAQRLSSAGEFASRTALIIGGSRGLGAVTAKLLAAGGARVFATYATGKAEAERLIDEIHAARGEGHALALPCDVRRDIAPQLQSLPPGITHLYYFATPRIFSQGTATFSRKRLAEFLSVYVDGFAQVVAWLGAQSPRALISILYPSTIAIETRPKGMTEYTMAKAAGEVLAKDLAAALGVSAATPRIPRVLTDQTATVVPVQAADPVDVMLPLLRAEP